MGDPNDSRPKLIPPLCAGGALEIVRERPQTRREVEHPHCDEHFLFTPHCAACLEAERTQAATAKATPVEPSQHVTQPKARAKQSSRSFGFNGNIPVSLTREPTLAEQIAREMLHDRDHTPSHDILDDIAGTFFKP